MRKWSVVLLIAALSSLTTAAFATPRGERVRAALEDALRDSLSVGRPTRGRLLHGRVLHESEYVRYRSNDERFRHGTDEMVLALEQAAKDVTHDLPGARLTVGDISRPNGGRFQPHRSHRNGRDVDVAFFMTDAEGDPAYLPRFERFTGDGHSRDTEGYLFDDARNWDFVASMLENDAAPVQYMFVSRYLKTRLLAEGRRRGAGEELLAKAEVVLDQPRRGGVHDDHFHIRIFCALDDRPRCADRPPFHAWYPGNLEIEDAHPALALLAR